MDRQEITSHSEGIHRKVGKGGGKEEEGGGSLSAQKKVLKPSPLVFLSLSLGNFAIE